MDNSSTRYTTSARYRSAACQRLSSITWAVTGAVTLGLPSRSPPIQETKDTGEISSGRCSPQLSYSARSRRLRNSGTARHRESSTTAKPHLASSTGVGRSSRKSSPNQICAISSRRRMCRRSRSRSVRPSSSSCARQRPISPCLWIRVRRVISVGWAVSTSSMRSSRTAATTAAGATPSASSSPIPLARLWEADNSGSASRDTLWCWSAILARLRNWLKARATGTSCSLPRLRSTDCNSSRAAAEPSRALLDSPRICSTRSRKGWPSAAATVSPSRRPRKLTLPRSEL